MGNGASASPYKISSTRHVRKYSKDYYDALAKIRSSSSSSGRSARDGYKYVTGDTLEPTAEEEGEEEEVPRGKKSKDRTIIITDRDLVLCADSESSYVVPTAGAVNSSNRLIHVDTDGRNAKAQEDRSFLIGVVE